MADKKVTPKGNGQSTVETMVKDGDVNRPLNYTIPSTPADFLKWAGTLPAIVEGHKGPDAVDLKTVYEYFVYALDLKQRADVREAVAAESTMISRDGTKIDLLKLEPRKLAAAVNGALMMAASTETEPQKAFMVARRKGIENGILIKDEKTDLVKAAQ